MLLYVQIAAGSAESGCSGPVPASLVPARVLTRDPQTAQAAAGAS